MTKLLITYFKTAILQNKKYTENRNYNNMKREYLNSTFSS